MSSSHTLFDKISDIIIIKGKIKDNYKRLNHTISMRNKSLFLIYVIVAVLVFTTIFTLVGSVMIDSISVEKNAVNEEFDINKDTAQRSNRTKIGEYSTEMLNSDGNRAHNIRTACKKLNGLSIASGGKLSFNEVVGLRTPENGFREANIILNGKYVKGYGGGVCQASSTLYNAWVLAGLEAEKVQGHSLPSSYIDMSRDATVTKYIDLVLLNTSSATVDISTKVVDNTVKVEVYGTPSRYTYRIYTERLKVIEPEILPEIEVLVDDIGDSEYEVNEGAKGYLTRAIIEVVDGEAILFRRELRRDYYSPINIQRIHKIKKPSSN